MTYCKGCSKERPPFSFREDTKECTWCWQASQKSLGKVRPQSERLSEGRTSIASPLNLSDYLTCECCGARLVLGGMAAHLRTHSTIIDRDWQLTHSASGDNP